MTEMGTWGTEAAGAGAATAPEDDGACGGDGLGARPWWPRWWCSAATAATGCARAEDDGTAGAAAVADDTAAAGGAFLDPPPPWGLCRTAGAALEPLALPVLLALEDREIWCVEDGLPRLGCAAGGLLLLSRFLGCLAAVGTPGDDLGCCEVE